MAATVITPRQSPSIVERDSAKAVCGKVRVFVAPIPLQPSTEVMLDDWSDEASEDSCWEYGLYVIGLWCSQTPYCYSIVITIRKLP